jgi:hypothetical protein
MAAEAIHHTLGTMSSDQILTVMKQLKQMALQSPEQARQLLLQNPQLCYALLQAQLQIGLVDPMTAQKMLQGAAFPAGPAPVASSATPQDQQKVLFSGGFALSDPAVSRSAMQKSAYFQATLDARDDDDAARD